MNLFINTIVQEPEFGISWLLAVVFSICCHEYAHAQTAVWFGDDTPERTGHLTLNPLRQMGFVSLIMLLFIGIAWGSVPVDERKLGTPLRRGLTAFAGPFTNILLAVTFFILLLLSLHFSLPVRAVRFFNIASGLNLALAVFNILPIPPLDGFAVLRSIFPKLSMPSSQMAMGIMIFFMFIVFHFAGKIFDLAFDFVAYCVNMVFA